MYQRTYHPLDDVQTELREQRYSDHDRGTQTVGLTGRQYFQSPYMIEELQTLAWDLFQDPSRLKPYPGCYRTRCVAVLGERVIGHGSGIADAARMAEAFSPGGCLIITVSDSCEA